MRIKGWLNLKNSTILYNAVMVSLSNHIAYERIYYGLFLSPIRQAQGD
jgi:hypothetical protein